MPLGKSVGLLYERKKAFVSYLSYTAVWWGVICPLFRKGVSDIMSEEKEGRKCDVEEKEEVGKEEITPGRFPFFLK